MAQNAAPVEEHGNQFRKKFRTVLAFLCAASRLFPAKERKRGIERSLAEAFNNSNLRVKKKSFS